MFFLKKPSLICVTTRKNQPSSYRFTQANQRNSWTIIDWTSQIPLIAAFSSENNQDVMNSLLLIIKTASRTLQHYQYVHQVA